MHKMLRAYKVEIHPLFTGTGTIDDPIRLHCPHCLEWASSIKAGAYPHVAGYAQEDPNAAYVKCAKCSTDGLFIKTGVMLEEGLHYFYMLGHEVVRYNGVANAIHRWHDVVRR